MEAASEEFVVYLQGSNTRGDAWYRVVVETNNITGTSTSLCKGKKRKGVEGQTISISPPEKDFGDERAGAPTISPVALIPCEYFGYSGGWTVIGDDIYWTGGCRDERWEFDDEFYSNLLKHNIHDETLTSWERLCSLTIPCRPFLAAVGRSIAVLAGTYHTMTPISDYDCQIDSSVKDDNWTKRGGSQSSGSVIQLFDSFYTTTVVEDPNKIVLYSLDKCSMLFMDASTGDILEENAELIGDAWEEISSDHLYKLFFAAHNATAVIHKRTFYWFTDELVLYGYDIDLRRWFQSECLQQQLHPLEVSPPRNSPLYPLLLGLPNGKFVVLVFQQGLYHMASFSVDKDVCKSILGVNVEHIQYFRFDDCMFVPFVGRAIRLKNTGSATRRG